MISGGCPGLGVRVSYLLPDADVSLPDEDTGVVDRLGEPELKHLEREKSDKLDLK